MSLRPRVMANSQIATRNAVLAGIGIGLLAPPYIHDDVAAVWPRMAELLGEAPFDMETGEGFSCMRCHATAE